MKEHYIFLRRFFSEPSSIGAIFPSSQILAKKMVCKMGYQVRPLRYLEVGAGSGAITKQIAKKITAKDTLDVVEQDHAFCNVLKKKYAHLTNVSLYEMSILDFKQKEYDCIFSSLPLNVFTPEMVEKILLKYKSLIKPGGYIVFFEYIGFGSLKRKYLSGQALQDFTTILTLKNNFVKNCTTEVKKVWFNIPPARVFYCHEEISCERTN